MEFNLKEEDEMRRNRKSLNLVIAFGCLVFILTVVFFPTTNSDSALVEDSQTRADLLKKLGKGSIQYPLAPSPTPTPTAESPYFVAPPIKEGEKSRKPSPPESVTADKKLNASWDVTIKSIEIVPVDYEDGRFHAVQYWVTDQNDEPAEILEATDYDLDLKADAVVYRRLIKQNLSFSINLWRGPQTVKDYQQRGFLVPRYSIGRDDYGFMKMEHGSLGFMPLQKDEQVIRIFSYFDQLLARASELVKSEKIKPSTDLDPVGQPAFPEDDFTKAQEKNINGFLAQRAKFVKYGLHLLAG